ncbi:MAG: thioredoxin-dependent thiol peroxidase [Candidatus Kapaibacterium sp.]
MNVSIGKKAPAFTARDHTGANVKLSDFKGSVVILYFYPKDDTSTCTKQACDYRDNAQAFAVDGAVVVGVSPDSVQSHMKFRAKYDLPFTLLADEDHAVCEIYGVWQEKSMYGRTYMGVVRSTVVIDAQGVVRAVFSPVNMKQHVKDLHDAVQACN